MLHYPYCGHPFHSRAIKFHQSGEIRKGIRMAYIQTISEETVQGRLGKKTAKGLLQNLISQLASRWEVHQQMGKLSERHLRDIGLTPNDLQSISTMPLSVDAATELSVQARGQSRNW